MSWLTHFIAGVSFFVGSLFGHPPPVAEPTQTVPVVHERVSHSAKTVVSSEPVTEQGASSSNTESKLVSTTTLSATTSSDSRGWVNIPSHLMSADLHTIQSIKSDYYSDGKAIYVSSSTQNGSSYSVVPSADPKKFRAISLWFGTDGQNVYYLDRVVEGADAKTFYVQNSGCWRVGVDAYHNYNGYGKINTYNPTSTPDATIHIKAGNEVLPSQQGDC